jgi:hypothetical protein
VGFATRHALELKGHGIEPRQRLPLRGSPTSCSWQLLSILLRMRSAPEAIRGWWASRYFGQRSDRGSARRRCASETRPKFAMVPPLSRRSSILRIELYRQSFSGERNRTMLRR